MLLLYLFFICTLFLVLQFGSVSLALGVRQSLVLAYDASASTFLFTLLFISVGVLTWSYYYMDSETLYRRFSSLIFLFLCSIFILVFSADLLSLFVAWDLLGFTSFFLVIFYRSRVSLGGGLLTSLTNRIGDVLLLAFFGLVCYGSCSPISWPLYILFFVGFTKSAQVPFSSWLPAAMLAPTPVSALVHSSTLVTAGIYLLYRYLPSLSWNLLPVGIITSLLAGLAASVEVDSKKVVALSTLSQLGLIVSSLGLGVRSFCFAHLNIHASFKALLFLAAGCMIHSVYGAQEVRSSVPFCSYQPLLALIVLLCLASMCGLVCLSGFFSKEAILVALYNSSSGYISALLFYIGIGLTIGYSLRFMLLVVCAQTFCVPL